MSKSKNADDLAHFTFFDFSKDVIEQLVKLPPSISAFQSFETFLQLSALGRYPSALIILGSAIESAAASTEHRPEHVTSSLFSALQTVEKVALGATKLPDRPSIDKFRLSRNRIAHFGFSSRDDQEAAYLSFSLGVPLFSGWAQGEHGIDLYGVLGELGAITQTAIHLIQTSKDSRITAVDATRGLRRWITFNLREFFMAEWEKEVLNDNESSFGVAPVYGSEVRERYKQQLVDDGPSVELDCPICRRTKSLFVSLNEDALKKTKTLLPDFARCVNCDIEFPPPSHALLRELCQPQLTTELAESTCKSYGLG